MAISFHVLREYAVEQLEVLFAEDVMSADVLTIPTGKTIGDVEDVIKTQNHLRKQRLIPMVDSEGIILGVISWQNVLEKALQENVTGKVDDFMITHIITVFPEESLLTIVDRMAANHIGVLPVVDQAPGGKALWHDNAI